MAAWVAEWRALIEKLITSSREGIRNASKFALAHKAHAEEVVQMIIERMNELAARERVPMLFLLDAIVQNARLKGLSAYSYCVGQQIERIVALVLPDKKYEHNQSSLYKVRPPPFRPSALLFEFAFHVRSVGAQVLHVWYQRGALPEHSEAVGKALQHVKSLGPVRTEEEERIEMQRHEVPPPPFRPKTHFAQHLCKLNVDENLKISFLAKLAHPRFVANAGEAAGVGEEAARGGAAARGGTRCPRKRRQRRRGSRTPAQERAGHRLGDGGAERRGGSGACERP